jgi:GNAT superfamily N-acetyltransferase
VIKVKNANKKECVKFGEPEWHKMDMIHYGKKVEWNEKKFRFKAEEDGKILGTISGKHESGVVYVGTIIVAEKLRGKGVGRILMNKVEEYAKKMNAHKIWLNTGFDWPAGKFYESLGYKIEAKLPNHHFHKDFVIYSKFI